MKNLLFAFAAMGAFAAGAVEVDGIAASVGSVAILKSDVYDEMRRRYVTDEKRFAEFRNALIERELILKAAKAAKMTMQDWVVEDRIRVIVEDSFGGDRTKLDEMLTARRISEADWRNRIKEDMIVNAMRWMTIDKNVSASPAMMKAEYANHPERYRLDKRVSISVILLSPENAGRKSEIDNLLKTEDFASLAKKYSSDKRAPEGGAWKDIDPREEFNAVVCEEIERTPKGAISKWIELDGWSFLLRKDDETGAGLRPFAEAYADIEFNVKESETKRLYDEWMQRLKSETYIKVY